MPPKNKNPLKDPRKVEEYKQKGENGILRHAIGQQAADIIIRRFAAQKKQIRKLEIADAKREKRLRTVEAQLQKAYADKMKKDMAADYLNHAVDYLDNKHNNE